MSGATGPLRTRSEAEADDFGISWAQPRFKHISVARTADVAKLDQIVGPKR